MPQPLVRHWLMKSEPSVFSIDDLQRAGKTGWDGVRNYQARNFMREMQVGDLVLFYHSSAQPPDVTGVAGLAKVVRTAYPDASALDPKSDHHDPKATKAEPIWSMVDIGFVEKFSKPVALTDLKKNPSLSGMRLLQRGQRLSVMPVEPAHFEAVVKMGRGA